MKLLLIQGANMEYLGRRQPELYGTTSAKELDAILRRRARELDVDLDILYTNTEGEAVSAIYKADRASIDGILFNPAGFLHAGHSLRDCLKSINAPAIEIHTGAWCDAVVDGHTEKAAAEWQRIVAGVKLAKAAGLEVHAGHGLDYETAETIAALPDIKELNIGYYMIGEALFVGLAETVRSMRAAMDRGRSRA